MFWEAALESPNALYPISMICDRPIVMESRARWSLMVTMVAIWGRWNCSLMNARLLVIRGWQRGVEVTPSWLISMDTLEGQAVNEGKMFQNVKYITTYMNMYPYKNPIIVDKSLHYLNVKYILVSDVLWGCIWTSFNKTAKGSWIVRSTHASSG